MIQKHLLFAVILSLQKGRKIEKTKINRLLELIDKVTGQKHKRDVGLDQFDFVNRMGIYTRIKHVTDMRWKQFTIHGFHLPRCKYSGTCEKL